MLYFDSVDNIIYTKQPSPDAAKLNCIDTSCGKLRSLFHFWLLVYISASFEEEVRNVNMSRRNFQTSLHFDVPIPSIIHRGS
jgi:hypothetical protein